MDINWICECVEKHAGEILYASDKIWEAAELAFCEYRSAGFLKEVLVKNGFQVESGIAGIETAFQGSYGTGAPVIGFLGEFDALSGLSQEAGLLEKKAVKECGNGHGCGHNLLGAGTLAAAIALKEYLEKTKGHGTVVYFGCPGEEGGSGKAFMARDGVFDGLDIALTWHPGDCNMVSSGSSLANIQVKYHFYGKSAHAAGCPHLGRSALDAVELMNVGANYLREHIIPQARIHYAITDAGGNFPGVVQAYAEVLYLLRAPKIKDVQDIYERVNQIAKGAAMMTGTETKIDFMKACSDTVPNSTLEKVLYDIMGQLPVPEYTEEERAYAAALAGTFEETDDILEEFAEDMEPEEKELFLRNRGKSIFDFCMPYRHKETPFSGSTDVGDVSHVCPTAQISTASWAAGTPVHTWQAASQGKGSIAHKSVLYTGKVLGCAAVYLMEHPSIVAEARNEHVRRTGGGFRSPIPEGIKPRKMV